MINSQLVRPLAGGDRGVLIEVDAQDDDADADGDFDLRQDVTEVF